jgi:hypothetical protein
LKDGILCLFDINPLMNREVSGIGSLRVDIMIRHEINSVYFFELSLGNLREDDKRKEKKEIDSV